MLVLTELPSVADGLDVVVINTSALLLQMAMVPSTVLAPHCRTDHSACVLCLFLLVCSQYLGNSSAYSKYSDGNEGV